MPTSYESKEGISCPCKECAGLMRSQLGRLEYNLDDIEIIVEDVPMTVCTECGKQLVPGVSAMAIGDAVQEVIDSVRAREIADRFTIHYREHEKTREFAVA